ncbi:MAG: hypothetical protein Q4C88_02895 [Akkermansia sp.]|nr:hypothetical protein [Akkermansia sp.]
MQEVPIVIGFTSGELSPWLDSRFDLQAYQRGARLLKNFTVLPYGGIRRRKGAIFVTEARSQEEKATRLVPFRYSEEDVLLLEFSPGIMRVFKDGALVRVSGLSAFELALPWSTAAQIRSLSFTQVNDVVFITCPTHPVVRLSRRADADWLVETLAPEPYPRATHATRDDQLSVSFNASGSTATLKLPSGAGTAFDSAMAGAEYVLADAEVPARTLFRNTSMSVIVFQCPDLATASVAKGAKIYVAEQGTSHHLYFTCRKAFNHALDFVAGMTSPADYPQHFMPGVMRLADGMPYEVCGDWELTTHGEWNAAWELWRTYDTAASDGADCLDWDWTTVKSFGQSAYEERKNWALSGSEKIPCRMVLVCISSSGMPIPAMMSFRTLAGHREYKFRITAVQNAGTATAAVEKGYLDMPSGFTTRRWSFGAFGPRNGYPAFSGFFQNRLWFGGMPGLPTTLIASCVDDYANFRMGSDADDALHLTLASDEQSRICWMCATRELLVGTAEGEWSLVSSDNGAITATSAAFKRQSAVGSEPMPVHAVENSVVFVQRGGRRMREISYKLESDGFSTVDLSLLAEHLFRSGVAEWCVQRGTDSYIWVLMNDGSLAVLTMNMEQQVTAWQRIDLPGRTPQHIATLPARNNLDDDVWFVTRNNTTGYVAVERICADNPKFVDLPQTVWLDENNLFSGAHLLAGGVICGWRPGNPEKVFTADINDDGSGYVVVPEGAGREIVYIGRPYESELHTMPLERDLSFNAVRQMGRVKVRLLESDYHFLYRSSLARTWDRMDTSAIYGIIPYTGALRLTQMPDADVGQHFVFFYNELFDFAIQAITIEVDQHGR